MPRLPLAVLVSMLFVPVAAAPAMGVTVGETFAGTTACDGITVVLTVPSGHNSYVVPSDGVLTSWSTTAESLGNRMGAIVYRPSGGNYNLVGLSDLVVPIGAGAKSYATSIAVKAGDLLGSWVEQRDGVHNVDLTCAFTGDPDQHSDWWYDTTPNILPPESPVSITGTHHDTGWTYSISAELERAPSITAISPAEGPAGGGTQVTITGADLAGTTAVTFGSAAAAITSATATSVTVTAPAGTPGTADVLVRTPGGSATLASAFTYTAVPADTAGSGAAPTAGATRILAARTACRRGGRCVTTGAVPQGATQVTETATGGTSLGAMGARANARVTTVCPITIRDDVRTFSCVMRLKAGRWTLTTRALAGSTVVAESTANVRIRAALHLAVTG